MLTKVHARLVVQGPRRKLANLRLKGLVRPCRRVQPPPTRLWRLLPAGYRKLVILRAKRLVSRPRLF